MTSVNSFITCSIPLTLAEVKLCFKMIACAEKKTVSVGVFVAHFLFLPLITAIPI